MSIEQIWIVGFTGHRPGDGPGRSVHELSACKTLLLQTLEELRTKASTRGGHIEVLTSLAAGADLEMAEAAAELGIAVHVILPLPEKQFQEDFVGDKQSWSRVKRLIEAASSEQQGGTFRVAECSISRPDCYHETTMQILHSCDLLVAVWNEQPRAGVAGTAEAVTQANQLGLPRVLINPANQERRMEFGKSDWPAVDAVVCELNDVLRTNERHSQTEQRGLSSSEYVFSTLDSSATDLGKRFRGRLVLAMALHFTAALLAATTASYTPVIHFNAEKTLETANATVHRGKPEAGDHPDPVLPKLMTGIELLLVIVAGLLMWQAHRGRLHQQWRRTRFATEVARGLRATARLLDPLDPIIVRHIPEWRAYAISFALNAHRCARENLSLEERRDGYLNERLIDQSKGYYPKRLRRAFQLSQWFSRIATFASTFAPLFILAALAMKLSPWKDEVNQNYLVATFVFWFPVVLPLLAGSAISFLVATDSARRAERYQLMIGRLNLSAKRLPGLKTFGAVSRAVSISEDIMVDELIEWYVASRTVGH